TLGLTWALRWPPALRVAGFAVLTVTTLRVATTWAAYMLAALTAGALRPDGGLWVLADPVNWIIAVAGAVLCVRARRLADDARQILPPEFQPTSPGGRFRSRLLLAASGAYALLLLLFV